MHFSGLQSTVMCALIYNCIFFINGNFMLLNLLCYVLGVF